MTRKRRSVNKPKVRKKTRKGNKRTKISRRIRRTRKHKRKLGGSSGQAGQTRVPTRVAARVPTRAQQAEAKSAAAVAAAAEMDMKREKLVGAFAGGKGTIPNDPNPNPSTVKKAPASATTKTRPDEQSIAEYMAAKTRRQGAILEPSYAAPPPRRVTAPKPVVVRARPAVARTPVAAKPVNPAIARPAVARTPVAAKPVNPAIARPVSAGTPKNLAKAVAVKAPPGRHPGPITPAFAVKPRPAVARTPAAANPTAKAATTPTGPRNQQRERECLICGRTGISWIYGVMCRQCRWAVEKGHDQEALKAAGPISEKDYDKRQAEWAETHP